MKPEVEYVALTFQYEQLKKEKRSVTEQLGEAIAAEYKERDAYLANIIETALQQYFETDKYKENQQLVTLLREDWKRVRDNMWEMFGKIENVKKELKFP